MATQVYIHSELPWIFVISTILSLLSTTPSGLNHSTLGLGLELDVSQFKYSVSPLLRVVFPVITGGLKTIYNSSSYIKEMHASIYSGL